MPCQNPKNSPYVQFEEPDSSGVGLEDVLAAALSCRKEFTFKARGYSMLPFIQDNDSITVCPVGKISISPGRVIAFLSPRSKKLVVHRIVALKNNAILTKGDSLSAPDGLINSADILGFVIRVKRGKRMVIFGLGPERRIIAILSRCGFFYRLTLAAKIIIPRRIREFIKCRVVF